MVTVAGAITVGTNACRVVRQWRGNDQSIPRVAMTFGKLNGNAGDACGDRQQPDARTSERFLEPILFRTGQADSAMVCQAGDFKAGNGRNTDRFSTFNTLGPRRLETHLISIDPPEPDVRVENDHPGKPQSLSGTQPRVSPLI
jgi:hypothetical protein